MSLGPEDLPDPFGEGGLSQVICACTSENFHFILTAATVKAICASCKAVNGEWPHQGQQVTVQAAAHTWTPGCDGNHPPGPCFGYLPPGALLPARDVLPQAGWGWAQEAIPAEPPQPAGLPKFSPQVANVLLRGGPGDGHMIYLPPECTVFWYGPARYQPTDQVVDSRAVWQAQ